MLYRKNTGKNLRLQGKSREFHLYQMGATLISLHIRSMWETICDAQAGFWLNSKFLSKFSRKPLSGISDQKAPPTPPENFRFEMTKVYSGIPPPHFGKLQIWDDQSLLWNTPLPISENFRFEMTKVYSGVPPPHFGKCVRSYVETNL